MLPQTTTVHNHLESCGAAVRFCPRNGNLNFFFSDLPSSLLNWPCLLRTTTEKVLLLGRTESTLGSGPQNNNLRWCGTSSCFRWDNKVLSRHQILLDLYMYVQTRLTTVAENQCRTWVDCLSTANEGLFNLEMFQ